MKKELIERLQKDLLKEKVILEKELENFAKENKEIRDDWNAKFPNRQGANMEEGADEAQEYDNLLSLEHSLEVKLRDVNAALEKIAQGSYGVCEKCGNQIEEERLLVCPEARLCMQCNQ